MRLLVMPYKRGSNSATALSQALGIRQVRLEKSTLKGSKRIVLLNWGSSDYHGSEEFSKCEIINAPEAVAQCSDKLKFFLQADPELCVPWTTDPEVVKKWVSEGSSVFARRLLNSHSGNGITELTQDNIAQWPKAPLYTRYIPKESEYRVHFMNGEIIDAQKKGLSRKSGEDGEVDPSVWKVRNLQNGFVFMRNFGETPKSVTVCCQAYIKTSPLDFGAIDVIYNRKQDRAYILEVNTAPGLVGTTVEIYAASIKKMLGGRLG